MTLSIHTDVKRSLVFIYAFLKLVFFLKWIFIWRQLPRAAFFLSSVKTLTEMRRRKMAGKKYVCVLIATGEKTAGVLNAHV